MSVITGTEPTTGDVEESRPRATFSTRLLSILARYGTIGLLVALVVVFTILGGGQFASYTNLLDVLSQASIMAVVAAGLTVTLAAGEFDLSIGYAASFAGLLVAGFISRNGFPVILAFLATMLIGAGIGSCNGVLITKVRINAVITTLGVGTILTGVGFAYTSSPIVSHLPDSFSATSIGKAVAGIPNLIWFMIGVLGLLWCLLNLTEFGQSIKASGGNAVAARLAGIRVDRVKITAFAISGACAALGGALLAALLNSGTLGAADGYLLQAFAAVFLGSATLKDGEFHMIGTLVGVLIIAIGDNGLAIVNAPTFLQPVFQGVVLILAVGLSSTARRMLRENVAR